jgi:hypothetical protein
MENRPVEGMIDSQPKRRGCFFWGCLSAGILLLLLIGVVGFLFYMFRDKFTEPAPRPVPVHQPKPGEYEEIKSRIARFDQAAQANQPAQLELTADDLNALMAGDKDLKELSGKAFVRIEGKEATLDVSIPLKEVPLMGERWFNGTVSVDVSLEDGKLSVTPTKAVIKGEQVSEKILDSFKVPDFASRVKDPKFQEGLKKIKSLEVRDGKIVISR